ncbi:MAG: cytochrome c oxidase subunit 3 [Saprospiraceae bacterium]|nr:cytochrome c oxidase subunit 3 [Saprospiraceae bacterium]HMW39690.1 cytochrome c oxidase subunit 3 [Saprospiraceae bacterium]HMX88833.1 cytochrome c oxidase subunit 3 [Saprospiraceae bacterium]HMZ39303.1 cytochrome c oxidase subunit 3 [Saprospiraceae bacterium]HNA65451.1 cytochrome c oxidase subunit 3 [Saprospiraceae bacterium]
MKSKGLVIINLELVVKLIRYPKLVFPLLAMQDQSFGIHRSWIILTLAISGMVMLFAAAIAAMIYLDVFHSIGHIKLPWLFYCNTVLLLLASWVFHSVNVLTIGAVDLYRRYSLIFALSLIFLILQTLAWHQLILIPQTMRAGSFLYLLSGLHFAHVLGGLPFLAEAWFRSRMSFNHETEIREKDRRKFRLLRTYWHFLDFLWIVLLLILTFMFMPYHK